MDFNLNEKQLNSLLEKAKSKSNIDFNEVKDSIEKGNLDDFVSKNLDKNSSDKLKKILGDKETAEKLLNTPEAKDLMKKILEGK